jgi:hypothetical protein
MLLLSVGGVTRQYCVFSYVLPHLPSSSPLWFSIVVIEAVLPWSSQTVEHCTRDRKQVTIVTLDVQGAFNALLANRLLQRI